ncbi:hypothetical protein ACFL35_15110, partial [Candidatus Riflebacteria bacterium]
MLFPLFFLKAIVSVFFFMLIPDFVYATDKFSPVTNIPVNPSNHISGVSSPSFFFYAVPDTPLVSYQLWFKVQSDYSQGYFIYWAENLLNYPLNTKKKSISELVKAEGGECSYFFAPGFLCFDFAFSMKRVAAFKQILSLFFHASRKIDKSQLKSTQAYVKRMWKKNIANDLLFLNAFLERKNPLNLSKFLLPPGVN